MCSSLERKSTIDWWQKVFAFVYPSQVSGITTCHRATSRLAIPMFPRVDKSPPFDFPHGSFGNLESSFLTVTFNRGIFLSRRSEAGECSGQTVNVPFFTEWLCYLSFQRMSLMIINILIINKSIEANKTNDELIPPISVWHVPSLQWSQALKFVLSQAHVHRPPAVNTTPNAW